MQMFTGIIEGLATIIKIDRSGTNKIFWLQSLLAKNLKIDQSLSHNGVCLTVEEINNDTYRVTAILETLLKSNFDTLKVGDVINLERSMMMNGRLDGHIVQGHVDTTARCKQNLKLEGSSEFIFEFDKKFAPLVIEKGSVCVNGVSLTVFDVKDVEFKVAIIPYTMQHTNFFSLKENDMVNIEFDMLGKYVNRIADLKNKNLLC